MYTQWVQSRPFINQNVSLLPQRGLDCSNDGRDNVGDEIYRFPHEQKDIYLRFFDYWLSRLYFCPI